MTTTINNQKKTWQPPAIKPHNMGSLNKFGQQSLTQKSYADEIEGVPINQLIEKYGSPLFVTSESQIRNNTQKLKRAFENRYPKVVHGWSYKTNYNGAICNIFHQEGSWAEVVSAFEYEKARALGIPGDKIIFNGPNKSRNILTRAVVEGARIHVDRQDELELIEDIGRELGKVCKVTLRLNFDTGYTEAWSRFGFNIESDQAMSAARYIEDSDYLHLNGLHSHIGTFILDTRAYASQIQIMCDFMNRVESETSANIESIDCGGGFASLNSLQGIYLPPEQVVPTLDQYAEAVCDTLLKNTKHREAQGRARPLLILESGRAMIDNAQTLLSSVVGSKHMPDGRRAVIMDAGVNLLFTGFWYNHPIKLSRPVPGVAEECVLYGPLCMNIDVVRKSIQLPPLESGEILQFESVGAYNNTQWMQFIEYRPNVVMIHSNDDGTEKPPEISVIRHAEDLQAMTAQEDIPKHLENPFSDEKPLSVVSV